MPDVQSPAILVYKLCSLLSGGENKEVTSKLTQYALKLLSTSSPDSVPNIDELAIIEKIKVRLAKSNRMNDALKIAVLHQKLKQCSIPNNRWSVLYLLYALSNVNDSKVYGSSLLFRQGLVASSTPVNPANDSASSNHVTGDSVTSSSGLGTAATPSSRTTTNLETPLPSFLSSSRDNDSQARSTTLPSRIGWTLTPSTNTSPQDGYSESKQPSLQKGSTFQKQSLSRLSKSKSTSPQISEDILIRQLLYIFQGIPTKNIKFSEKENSFCVDPSVSIDKRHKQAVHRLGELGWLHNHIKKYITSHDKDKAFGLVGQAFCAALQQELIDYYQLLSVIQSQVQQIDAGAEKNGTMTLSKLTVWISEPFDKLKWLAILVDNCRGKKGGALVSMVHSFLFTGDMSARSLTRRILHVVSQPIFHIIHRWIYDGELYDPFQEFFVSSDLGVGNERLWYDKYRMRTSMIPTFIKLEHAQKILMVGKSINFLRLVCRDRSDLAIKDKSKQFNEDLINDPGYSLEFATELKPHVDHAYDVTSKRLLQVLTDRYKMLTHIHALRKFLLLGQGDFIRHLLDLLHDELSKPANELYRHNLSGPVEAAVRASNAQFEDPDVLARLDFRLLEINPGDRGWDVFSLDYHVDPPLNTLITPDVLLVYLRIFIFLWRAKRMEFNLASIWTGMMEQSRKLSPCLPNLHGVLHSGHILAAEMVHFVHQMQYYIAFEVLECSWADLQSKLEEAKDLDEIITAHHAFLQSLMKRCLLDHSSSHLLTQLRTIFDQIVKFENLQRDIYEQARFEMESRMRYEKTIADAEKKGVWGADVEKEGEELVRRKKFRKVSIPEMRARLKVCTCAYEDMVVMFLQQLSKESDANLRNLRWRLDFNEYYRYKEKKTKKSSRSSKAVK